MRAVASGVVNLSLLDPREPHSTARLGLELSAFLDQQQMQIDLHGALFHLGTAILLRGSPGEAAQTNFESARKLYRDYTSLRHLDQGKSRGAAGDRGWIARAREGWVKRFGDSRDPRVQQAVEETAAALRRARQASRAQ